SVCLAVDFAHKRGVLHRDLKPANIILGDFGEVSVLDWGLAKLVGVDDDDSATMSGGPIADSGARAQHTQAGAMLGTPGYMSPEQARGDLDLDERTDVYALGAIVFEVLALEPLHAGESVAELVASTLRDAEARPSARGRKGVPVQLEAMCVKATALDRGARFRTARDLADAMEAFLDAELAVEMRSKMADGHVAAARASLTSGERASDSGEARIGALRELGRALALDPTHGGALRAMAEVIATVPRELPPEAERQLAQSADSARRASMRAIARRYVFWTAFLPLAFWMGIRQRTPTAIAVGGAVLSGALALWAARRPRVTRAHTLGVFAVTTFTMSSMSWLLGPFVVVPALVSTNTMLFAAQSDRRDRRLFTLGGMLAVVVPFALEQLGVVTPGYRFTHGIFEILPRATALPEVQTLVTLLLTSLGMMYFPTRAVGRIRDSLAAAERRVFVQAWQLRQLVPEGTRDAVKD
ncbi:MAG: serine/threonine-protein kinase, partial [Deltaproteobacteria bacterium]